MEMKLFFSLLFLSCYIYTVYSAQVISAEGKNSNNLGDLAGKVKKLTKKLQTAQNPESSAVASLKLEKLKTGNYFFYYDVKNPVSWFEAHDICVSQGMRLLDVEDEAEHQQLVTKLKGMEQTNFWCGLNDLNTEGTFVNSGLGSSPNWDVVSWSPGEPNDANKNQNCAQIGLRRPLGRLGWSDENCREKCAGFICKMNKICSELVKLIK